MTVAHAGVPTNEPFEHKVIPGASPEPISDRTGPRGKEDMEAFFDALMATHLTTQRIAGATVVLVKDGEVYFAKGYGYADVAKQVPMDPERTLIRPGSVSKLFTWTAVMQLVEEGKLDLDQDVKSYLPQFQTPPTWEHPITLRNLMTHSAGFEESIIGYLFTKTAAFPPLAEYLKMHMPAQVRRPATDFTEGLSSSYSNWGAGLTGLVVANVSGMPYEDYVNKKILTPLGMTSSSFAQPLPAELAERVSKGYQYENGNFRAGNYEYVPFASAGALAAPANDMAKFMIAQLQDGRLGKTRIMQEATAQYMHSRRFSPSPYVNGSGLGFEETWLNGRRWIHHPGASIYFHSSLALLKEEQLGLFICYNSRPVRSGANDLEVFTDRYYPAKLPQLKPPSDFNERAATYEGTYRAIGHSFTKNEKPFELLSFGDTQVRLTRDNTLLIGGAFDATQWVEVAPATYRRIDTQDMISFFEDRAGSVDGISSWGAFNPLYKLKWHETLQWHGFIIIFGLLCFFAASGTALRNWKADRMAEPASRRARRIAALLGPCHVALLIALFATLASGLEELVYAWPMAFRIGLVFPLLAIPLTLGMLYYAYRAWRDAFWTLYGRVQYSVTALMGVAVLWSLNFMNLVGFKFG